jgi:hypothetical protein
MYSKMGYDAGVYSQKIRIFNNIAVRHTNYESQKVPCIKFLKQKICVFFLSHLVYLVSRPTA